MLPRKPFRFLDFLYLFARAFWIPFVEKVGKGGKFVALKAARVHVVHDGDELTLDNDTFENTEK